MHKLFPDLQTSEIIHLEFLEKDSSTDPKFAVDKIGLKAVKALKKDFTVEDCLCKFNDVIIVEVLINAGKQSYDLSQSKLEQIFYIYTTDRLLSLGELFWTDYHWFYGPVFKFLQSLDNKSLPINDEALFIGGRDNFTHAFLDYGAGLTYAKKYFNIDKIPVYVGVQSKIQCMAFESLGINSTNIYQDRLLSKEIQLDPSLSLKLTRVKSCYAFRHVSIFSLVNFAKKSLYDAIPIAKNCAQLASKKIYLSRMSNDRVINQNQVNKLMDLHGFFNLNNIHEFSIPDRMSMLNECTQIIVPPGSDNVNAILFSPDTCNVIQMLSISPHQSLYETRLHHYSSLRYILPLFDRIKFWLANEVHSNISGKWSEFKIAFSLPS